MHLRGLRVCISSNLPVEAYPVDLEATVLVARTQTGRVFQSVASPPPLNTVLVKNAVPGDSFEVFQVRTSRDGPWNLHLKGFAGNSDDLYKV